MDDKNQAIMASLMARATRRRERREFIRLAATAAVVTGGASMLAACGDGNNNGPNPVPTPAPTPPPAGLNDGDVLNFALQLEYLEAQFYAYAANGNGLAGSLLSGTGTQGTVRGGRQVNFTDPVVRQYAREIAGDELAHVKFLRDELGAAAVAMPDIDVSASADGAFSAAARAAGLVGAGQAFDPYASDENFLLGAYIFEDVGVTAYKGAAPLITDKTYLEAAAGILAAEAYHAGLIRTTLYAKGLNAGALRTAADKISDARDSLDGPADLDQGISPVGNASNLVPTDGDGIAYSRSAAQVLNIVYLTPMMANSGGFFPSGLNGKITMSAGA